MDRGEDTEPFVSIGLPVFNGEPYVERAVRSLLAQRHRNLELVICDNASTDATWSLCQDLAAADPRVRLVRQTATVPVMQNFERVLAEARADLFMFAAVDDEWDPTFVTSLVAALEARPLDVVAMTAYQHSYWDRDEVGDVQRFAGSIDPRHLGSLRRALLQASARAPYFQYLYGLFRMPFLRRAFERYPLTISSDGLFAIQLALAGSWGYVDEVLTTRHVRRLEWPERYRDDELARSIGHPLAELRLVLAAGPYLLRSSVIKWQRKLLVPLVVARLAVKRLPIFLVSLRDTAARARRRETTAGAGT